MPDIHQALRHWAARFYEFDDPATSLLTLAQAIESIDEGAASVYGKLPPPPTPPTPPVPTSDPSITDDTSSQPVTQAGKDLVEDADDDDWVDFEGHLVAFRIKQAVIRIERVAAWASAQRTEAWLHNTTPTPDPALTPALTPADTFAWGVFTSAVGTSDGYAHRLRGSDMRHSACGLFVGAGDIDILTRDGFAFTTFPEVTTLYGHPYCPRCLGISDPTTATTAQATATTAWTTEGGR